MIKYQVQLLFFTSISKKVVHAAKKKRFQTSWKFLTPNIDNFIESSSDYVLLFYVIKSKSIKENSYFKEKTLCFLNFAP